MEGSARFAIAFFTPEGEKLASRVIEALRAFVGPVSEPFVSPVAERADSSVAECADSSASADDSGKRSLTVFDKNRESLKTWTRREFANSSALIFIGATGIAVRMLDGLMRGKDKDPAVLVLDEKGRFVIPLLSGHLGGANRLAAELADKLAAQAVITTATDINHVFAVDVWAASQHCVLENIPDIKHISAVLLRGEQVGFSSDFPVTGQLASGLVWDGAVLEGSVQNDSGKATQAHPALGERPKKGICVSLKASKKPFDCTLNVIPRIAILGAGCRKNTSIEHFESLVLETLARCSVSVRSLKMLASIDLKRAEPCLLAFADKYDLNFCCFSPEVLQAVPGEFTASAFVREQTGVDNVCERAAVAGGGSRLLLPKTAQSGVTLALAIQEWQCVFP